MELSEETAIHALLRGKETGSTKEGGESNGFIKYSGRTEVGPW